MATGSANDREQLDMEADTGSERLGCVYLRGVLVMILIFSNQSLGLPSRSKAKCMLSAAPEECMRAPLCQLSSNPNPRGYRGNLSAFGGAKPGQYGIICRNGFPHIRVRVESRYHSYDNSSLTLLYVCWADI